MLWRRKQLNIFREIISLIFVLQTEKTNVQLNVARMDNLRFEKRSIEHIEEILAIAEEQFEKEEQAQMNI